MTMTTTAMIVGIISSIALLVLNFSSLRRSAAAAGHGRKQMLQMALIWVIVFAGLTIGIGLFAG